MSRLRIVGVVHKATVLRAISGSIVPMHMIHTGCLLLTTYLSNTRRGKLFSLITPLRMLYAALLRRLIHDNMGVVEVSTIFITYNRSSLANNSI